MNNIFKKICFSFLISQFLLVSVAFAALTPLVPCGPGTSKPSCQFCDLLTLIERIINFALYNIAIPLSVIFIVYGGFVIMTAGSSPERVKTGRSVIKAAVIGLLIALFAWMIVDTVLTVLAGEKFSPWSFNKKIICR